MAACCFLAGFPVACSVCFLTNPRTTCLGMALPTGSWALPHQPLNKKRLHRPAYRPMTTFFLRKIPSSQIHGGSGQDGQKQPAHNTTVNFFLSHTISQAQSVVFNGFYSITYEFIWLRGAKNTTQGLVHNELHPQPFYYCGCCF